jgi:hypothetical protein
MSELMARHSEHVVPIWQTDPRPERATSRGAFALRFQLSSKRADPAG